jgi:hypothetical protein
MTGQYPPAPESKGMESSLFNRLPIKGSVLTPLTPLELNFKGIRDNLYTVGL